MYNNIGNSGDEFGGQDERDSVLRKEFEEFKRSKERSQMIKEILRDEDFCKEINKEGSKNGKKIVEIETDIFGVKNSIRSITDLSRRNEDIMKLISEQSQRIESMGRRLVLLERIAPQTRKEEEVPVRDEKIPDRVERERGKKFLKTVNKEKGKEKEIEIEKEEKEEEKEKEKDKETKTPKKSVPI